MEAPSEHNIWHACHQVLTEDCQIRVIQEPFENIFSHASHQVLIGDFQIYLILWTSAAGHERTPEEKRRKGEASLARENCNDACLTWTKASNVRSKALTG